MITITSIDAHVRQLFDILTRVAGALTKAGIEYRVVGGVAVYLHVEAVDPLAARLTRDVDIAVDRRDLHAIDAAVREFGFHFRHVAGLDMLVDAAQPNARSAVHLVATDPGFSQPTQTAEGVLLAPVGELLKMKLASFRLKDQVHLKDLDAVGLVTPEIEAQLSEVLRERLRVVRSTE